MRVFKKWLNNGHLLTATVYVPGDRDPFGDYFSVTAEEKNPRLRRDDGIVCCGCMHDDVLRHWPALRDVVALHLSDDQGAPMHAVANGWYWLAGSCGGLEERYHGANDGTHDAAKCRVILRDYLRLSEEETTDLVETTLRLMAHEGKPAARLNYEQVVKALRPRWAEEARSAIAAYGGSVVSRDG